MASKGQLKLEARLGTIEKRIDNIVREIGHMNLVRELNNEYKSTDGKEPQPARGHGAENVETDDPGDKEVTGDADQEPGRTDEDGGGEGVEPGATEEGSRGRGYKQRVQDKEFRKAYGGS
jgi:hypothetical protein